MKRKISLTIVSTVFVLAVILGGCERLPNDNMSVNSADSLTITPSSADIETSVRREVEFKVTGGNGNYAWSLGNNSLGTMTSAGNIATYQNYTNSIGTNSITAVDTSGLSGTAAINQE